MPKKLKPENLKGVHIGSECFTCGEPFTSQQRADEHARETGHAVLGLWDNLRGISR